MLLTLSWVVKRVILILGVMLDSVINCDCEVNDFPVHNMQLLNSSNTSLHLHSVCRIVS